MVRLFDVENEQLLERAKAETEFENYGLYLNQQHSKNYEKQVQKDTTVEKVNNTVVKAIETIDRTIEKLKELPVNKFIKK
jgi:hypothetical protein